MQSSSLHNTLFRKIYEDTYDKVFHFIYRLTNRNDQLTDDLVQDCYIRLWEVMDTLTTGEKCLPLLYTIARGQVIDYYRKRLVELGKLAQWQQLQEIQADTTPAILTCKEIKNSLNELLTGMPARRKEIFLLCREEGLSYKEIAQRLQISVDSVEKQMHLALKLLKKRLPGELTLTFLLYLACYNALP